MWTLFPANGVNLRFLISVAGAFVLISLGVATTVALQIEHDRVVRRAQQDAVQAAKLAGVIVDQMVRSVDGVVSTMQTALRYETADFESFVQQRQSWLAREVADRPLVKSYGVFDRHGKVLSSTVEGLVGRNVEARDYFKVHAEGEVRGSYVTDPIASVITGERLFLMSWPLLDASRNLVGVVAMSFDTRAVEDVLAKVMDSTRQHATILKANGAILTSVGHIRTQALHASYIDLGLSALLDDPALKRGGVAEAREEVVLGSKAVWLATLQPFDTLDGAIVLTRPMSDVLAPWRMLMWTAVVAFGLLAAAITAAAGAMMRLIGD
ncbi:MAG: hypothetical protein KDE35_13580 [Geminicoccaceae bacterium]|nr:hypothetical protein [Geminicoccaceae bacterium]